MSNARVDYPDPEELEAFYRDKFRLSSKGAPNLSQNLFEDRAMRGFYGEDLDKVCGLLSLMAGAEYRGDKQSKEGASYKSLAYVAHIYGLNDEERGLWYQAGESIPLSQGHVSYLINNVQGRNRLLEEAETLLGKG